MATNKRNVGRPATTAKRIMFCAPQDVLDILDSSGKQYTAYIIEAIKLKEAIDLARDMQA